LVAGAVVLAVIFAIVYPLVEVCDVDCLYN
jgi:hypothetical protein